MSILYENYSEKRSYLRLEIDATIRFKIPETNEIFQGKTTNLSGGGIQFYSYHELPINSVISASISSEKATVPPLSAKVRILRSEDCSRDTEANDNGNYRIAAEVIEVI